MSVNVRTQLILIAFKMLSFKGSHCVKPPTPDDVHKLKLQYNPAAPPAHGETIMYICDAGPNFNRFESDFNKWNYTLTCQENNVFTGEPDVPWPTCADSKESFKIQFI